MKVWSITHEINGIRMHDGQNVHTFPNQGWLAEAHARLITEAEQLRATVAAVRKVLLESRVEPHETLERVNNAINGDF